MATDWKIVLYFPRALAWMTIPSVTAMPRNPVRAISLAIMTITIQTGIRSSGISMIIVPETNILSTNGSRNLPKTVMVPCFLAKKPSKISVIDAIPKNRAARKLPHLPGKVRHISTIGMQPNLIKVNVFGRLSNLCLESVFIGFFIDGGDIFGKWSGEVIFEKLNYIGS